MKFGSFSAILNEEEYKYAGYSTTIITPLIFKITHSKEGNSGDIDQIEFLNKTNEYVMKIYKDTMIDVKPTPKLINYFNSSIDESNDNHISHIFLNSLNYDIKLCGYFLEDCGSIDVFDTLTNLLNGETNIWMRDTKNKMYQFTSHMCKALNYLEENKMCHFDIKPENIVYNNKDASIPFGKRFKLIDFGFAEVYPFKKYVNKLVGSLFYTPYYHPNNEYPEWALKINTNDWKYNPVQKKYYHYTLNKNNPELLYKTDIFSMGIVLNQLMFYINNYFKETGVTLFEINNNKLYNIIQHMTHKDIETRFNSEECISFLIKCNGNLFDIILDNGHICCC